MLGKIEFDGQPVDITDPNQKNLVAEVSTKVMAALFSHSNEFRTSVSPNTTSPHLLNRKLKFLVKGTQLKWWLSTVV